MRVVLAFLLVFAADGAYAADPSGRTPSATNLMDLTIEQLPEIKVVGASNYTQSSDTAPASVSVVTADE